MLTKLIGAITSQYRSPYAAYLSAVCQLQLNKTPKKKKRIDIKGNKC